MNNHSEELNQTFDHLDSTKLGRRISSSVASGQDGPQQKPEHFIHQSEAGREADSLRRRTLQSTGKINDILPRKTCSLAETETSPSSFLTSKFL